MKNDSIAFFKWSHSVQKRIFLAVLFSVMVLTVVQRESLLHFFKSPSKSSFDHDPPTSAPSTAQKTSIGSTVLPIESTSDSTATSTKLARTTVNDSAIIYLCNQARELELVRSLQMLFENFNCKHRYRVIIFYDDKYGREHFDVGQVLSQLNVSADDKSLIEFEYLRFVFPKDFSEANESQVGVWSHAFPGYNHMIAFWALHIFHHPKIRSLQYYLRLDTDTYIFEKTDVDVFELMQQHGYHYGFRAETVDPDWVVKGMALFVQKYVRDAKLEPAQPDNLQDVMKAEQELADVRTYYNNFEVVHVPTFLRSNMEAFRQAFYDTNRIYTHRWRDAPQRFVMVNLFLKPHEVYRICEWPYEHQAIRLKSNEC